MVAAGVASAGVAVAVVSARSQSNRTVVVVASIYITSSDRTTTPVRRDTEDVVGNGQPFGFGNQVAAVAARYVRAIGYGVSLGDINPGCTGGLRDRNIRRADVFSFVLHSAKVTGAIGRTTWHNDEASRTGRAVGHDARTGTFYWRVVIGCAVTNTVVESCEAKGLWINSVISLKSCIGSIATAFETNTTCCR